MGKHGSVQQDESAQRELDFWCDLLIESTKEIVENKTCANSFIYRYIYRNVWSLQTFDQPLASVKAYNEYKELSGFDIRNFNWLSPIISNNGQKTINGKDKVEQLFKFEHMTTAYDFKENLITAYKNNILDKKYVVDLIKEQKICWITFDEDKSLSKNGFVKSRVDLQKNITPEIAYQMCGIEIEKSEIIPLIQKGKQLLNNAKNTQAFFVDLQNYFIDNEICINGKQIELKTFGQASYATIYKKNIWVNIRLKSQSLNDIGLFIEGEKAKQIFNKFLGCKEAIEKAIGYKLVWNNMDNKKATRISRFGCRSNDKNMFKDGAEPYDFDLDIERTAEELIKFYNIFILDTLHLFN